ncbi:MAG: shikimate dehydrogenase [Pseudomonadales bacterium]
MSTRRSDNSTARYAVIGNPIGQSKSPLIHRLFAEQCAQPMEYDAVFSEIDQFGHTVAEFFANGGSGLNITVPFKQQAWKMVDDSSEAASLARAVNTIKRKENGDLFGTNTDGVGLRTDLLDNLLWSVRGKRVLVLGAGGAVRGVMQPLLAEQPELIAICNRSLDKAEQLVMEFDGLGPILALKTKALKPYRFDLVINATSASLHGELPEVPDSVINDTVCVYDMMYQAQATIFMRWAENLGAAQCSDGLGMLVEQAAESFSLWRGMRPDTANVIRSVRATLELPA